MRLRLTLMLPLALVMLFAGCSYSSLASARFTYSVVYSVTTTLATPVDISYRDENWRPTAPTPLANLPNEPTPWSLELPATGYLTYNYSDPLYPMLSATAGALADGESITVKISWKDYRTGFTEETLAIQIVEDDGSIVGTPPLDVTLYSPELPLVR